MANLSLNQTSGMWGGLSGILGDSWTASTFQSQSNRDTNHKRGGEGDKRVFSMRLHHHPVERIQSNGRFGNNHFHHRWVFHEKLSVGNNCPNWSECYTGAVSWTKIVKSCEGDALHQLVANAKCYSCSNVPRRSQSLFKTFFFEAIMAALGCLVSYLTLRIDVKKFSIGFRKHSLPAYLSIKRLLMRTGFGLGHSVIKVTLVNGRMDIFHFRRRTPELHRALDFSCPGYSVWPEERLFRLKMVTVALRGTNHVGQFVCTLSSNP